jgi:hypothetical protein
MAEGKDFFGGRYLYTTLYPNQAEIGLFLIGASATRNKQPRLLNSAEALV